MRSEVAKRMLSEMPEEIKQKASDMARDMIKKNEKTSSFDMQRMFDYLDKAGISYTVDNNPSSEKIEEIKAGIARQEALADAIRKR